MAKVERFEELDAWRLARAVTKKIYDFSNSGPFARDFGLRDQMRRAAVSILSNIAEGFERHADRSFHQFLVIANGSAAELRAQLYVALDLGYISNAQFDDCRADIVRIGRMLTGLMQYLKKTIDDSPSPNHPTNRPCDPQTM